MKMKRIISFVLAGLMVVPNILALKSVEAEAVAPPTIEFVGNRSPYSAEIIEGNSVEILARNISQYLEGDPVFTIENRGGADTDKIKYDAPDGASGKGSIRAEVGSKGTYGIKGNYFALLDSTIATEKWKDVNTGEAKISEAKVKLTQKPAIIRESSVTIKSLGTESKEGLPQFAVENAKGIFAGYQFLSASRSGAVVSFALKKEGVPQEFRFEITPTQNHPAIIKDNGDGTTTIIKEAGKYIAENSTFTIDVGSICASDLLLRVYTAQEAADALKLAILDATKSNSYIILDNNDALDWITKEFKMLKNTTMYGADAALKWQWVPNNSADDKVVDINDNGKEYATALLNIKEDDVYGKIKATISVQNFDKTVPAIPATAVAEVDVVIKGRGVPPRIDPMKQYKGGTTNTDIKIEKIPTRMDVYDGTVDGFKEDKDVTGPYKFTARAYMGQKNGAAEYLVIESSNPEALKLYVGGSSAAASYGEGAKIQNPNITGEGSVQLDFVANKEGTTQLKFKFYGKGQGGKIQQYGKDIIMPPITVDDSTPSQDTALKSLDLKSPELEPYISMGSQKGVIDYGFKSDERIYNLELPYKAVNIQIKPIVNDSKANKVEINSAPATSGSYSTNIPVEETGVTKVEVKVTAQDTRYTGTYILNLNRAPKNNDSSLKSLELFTETKYGGNQLLEGFKPNKTEYALEVPYKYDKLRVSAIANSVYKDNIKVSKIVNGVEEDLKSLDYWGGILPTEKEWLELDKPTTEPTISILKVKVTAEDQNTKTEYTVKVKRLPPSRIATLDNMEIIDNKGEKVEYIPKFKPDTDSYDVNIPYIKEKLKFNLKPTDEKISKIECVYNDANGVPITPPIEMKPNVSSPIQGIAIPTVKADMKPFNIDITVTPESMEEKDAQTYTISVLREQPSHDASLQSLGIKDQGNKKIELDFFPNTMDYTIEVPYEVEKVILTPKANFESDSNIIKVNERKVISGNDSSPIKLEEYPAISTITVKSTAEDGVTIKQYNINIKRSAPSSESLLKSLTVSGIEKLDPIFIPDRFNFKGTTTAGAKTVTVTPTAMHEKALIKVNGKTVVSGQASEAIDLLYINTTITIEVTAQNGTSKSTYKVNVTNDSLIEKTSNADLKKLRVEEGYLEPKFQPSTTKYDVYVKEENSYINIFPKKDDSLAEMKVFKGKKEIGDFDGNYSEYLDMGENNFTIEVTSPDKKVTKKYALNVYRNDEEKLGPNKPIAADAVDYERDKNAVVDISKYSVVSAEVFNELMKYPDNTITFVGNDYSLKFKGSDIKKIIPHSTTYDLGMTFNVPEELEDKATDLLYDDDDNRRMSPVFIYFKHHGALPATATFSISLGKKYKNDLLYWNYYNEERDRIDYYGYVETNSKGTFALPIDHFSLYFTTRRYVHGSEDKTGSVSTISKTENLSTGVKIENPYTGKD